MKKGGARPSWGSPSGYSDDLTPSYGLMAMTSITEARNITLALLAERAEGATVCPSEVARALVAADNAEAKSGDWRAAMPIVHAAVDQLVVEGSIKLSWKGKKLTARAGPYRINRSR